MSNPPDNLNAEIGVLTRREVEARLLKPLIAALSGRFGQAEVLEVLRETIIQLAQEQGAELAQLLGDNSAGAFQEGLQFWQKGGAMELEMVEQTAERLSFNVTRCRYAELYRALGMEELGAVLSCNRDFSLMAGFNPTAELTRTQTIMSGASHCDFRYRFKVTPEENTKS